MFRTIVTLIFYRSIVYYYGSCSDVHCSLLFHSAISPVERLCIWIYLYTAISFMIRFFETDHPLSTISNYLFPYYLNFFILVKNTVLFRVRVLQCQQSDSSPSSFPHISDYSFYSSSSKITERLSTIPSASSLIILFLILIDVVNHFNGPFYWEILQLYEFLNNRK